MANSDECSICWETLQAEEITIQLLCAHEFHTACIDEWLSRKKTCPICRKRVDRQERDDDSEDDDGPVLFDIQLLDISDRRVYVLIPRSRRLNRNLPETDSHMTEEEGVSANFFRYLGQNLHHPATGTPMTPESRVFEKIRVVRNIMYSFLALAVFAIQLVRTGTFLYSRMFESNSLQLETLSSAKIIRNSDFNSWNTRLVNLHGIVGRVPVRLLDFSDTNIRIEYFIKEEAKTGDILLQTGFIPTHSMDKKRYIYDEGPSVNIEFQENDVKLVISHFGVNIKEEWLSGNKKGTIFSGTLILRKERQNISVYLQAKNGENLLHERQELYFSTDTPYTRAPDGKFIHTFEYVYNHREDSWLVFNTCNRKKATVVMSSTLFHEPSCNKKIYMHKNGQFISNAKHDGYTKCGHT